MNLKCATCNKSLKNQPSMEIFTIDSGIWRNFCLDCIKMGYNNLTNLTNPNKGQVDLLVKFKNFIEKQSKRKRAVES